MKPIVKNTLIGIAAFIGYRFYKMYELGESIVVKPLDWRFVKLDWANLNSVSLVVTIELLNPTNTRLAMRGVDGTLSIGGLRVSNFFSKPFDIVGGRSTFDMVFKFDTINSVQKIIDIVKSGTNIPIEVTIRKRIPFFTLVDKFKLSVTEAIYKSVF